ncbi:restriction endonuclease subunit S [Raoultella ornithinolytica]|uniref:restriction endonuclease subunit S n=1 Tax=Raoultella TaxID=160674 RepID=UPI0002CD0CAE|nr:MULTISPECIES: restriction endonuclease subunit S [Raoultella]AGJ87894.1 type I restriction-modification system, specificity (S) subunit [Raoultella ornithinolytica B6]EKW1878529.1 restriction endonuclease subunit S [Raoultella ornithinolytica]ELS5403752.1 restriction endonuclease subunit S [Raoultella ornithinolytica]ELS5457050.1 restriction endonuclease subunit S [Raoultella ornithinolytica]ELS5482139.1 restriction endonuclease subunit S [Raoultella ornithinolytica]
MAKYKAYPEYKDSGVEWFDVKPLSWKVTRLKLETFMNMGQSPSSDDCNIEGDGLAFLQGNAEFGKVTPVEKQYCPVAKKTANPGDILFSVRAPVGAMNFADKKYGIGRGLCSIAASAKVTSPFLWWLLPTYKYQLDAIATGSTFEAVSAEQLGNLCFALPSISEQSQIAAFLDHETAKIDNLIEKQQQLIELLKEKRQAVISHAVTKGLNPDVPMKDSGVEWLGEVPEHWRVGRIKNYAKIESGHTPSRTKPEYWVSCNIPWVSLNDSKQLKEVDYIEDTFYKISELGMANSSAHLLPARAVVFTRDASIGLSAITTKSMAVSQHLIAWVCDEKFIIPEFLLLVFYAMEKEFERYTFGATIKTIGMDNVRGLKSTFPPVEEQHNLIDWAFNKIEKIKSSISKVEDMLYLLQERRTALISAAVTGKIDVRDWVAPDTQDAEEPEEASA